MDGARPDHRDTASNSSPTRQTQRPLSRILGLRPRSTPPPVEGMDEIVREGRRARLRGSAGTALAAHVVLALAMPAVFWDQAPPWRLFVWAGLILSTLPHATSPRTVHVRFLFGYLRGAMR